MTRPGVTPLNAALIVFTLALPAAAQSSQSPGAEAFARRDFAAAAEYWLSEASAGSPRAKLGLGLMNDLGLGMPRDAAKAFRWYIEAAEAGLPEAQFNVAVMLDSGAGTPPDSVAAAVWYARAAANGHHRAEYNLGLLYEAGDGVPRNPDLARYWLGLAAPSLPAAAERLASLSPTKPDQRSFVAPELLAGAIVADAEGPRAELVWSAPPAPKTARVLVEVARLPAGNELCGTILFSTLTEASALTVRLAEKPGPSVWRASLVDRDDAHYAAGPWQRLSGGGEDEPAPLPKGLITLRISPGDKLAERFATELASTFSEAGLWVRIQPASGTETKSSVHYVFAEDSGLASTIADFLPVLRGGDQVQASDPDIEPGEIVVRLIGGPEEATAP